MLLISSAVAGAKCIFIVSQNCVMAKYQGAALAFRFSRTITVIPINLCSQQHLDVTGSDGKYMVVGCWLEMTASR